MQMICSNIDDQSEMLGGIYVNFDELLLTLNQFIMFLKYIQCSNRLLR